MYRSHGPFSGLVSSVVLGLGLAAMAATAPTATAQDTDSLGLIQLPDGFRIEVYADNVPNARMIVLSPTGTLFVSTRREGKVYAVRDEDGDGFGESVFVLADSLNLPNGVALKDGALYVAEVDKIWRYDGIEERLADPPEPVLVTDELPSEKHHGWKFIAFGPDGKLYVPIGAPCNICDPDQPYASILKMDHDGSNVEVVARGVRNSVGFNWHPDTGELWFTDNGRDMLGDDIPPCELNRVTEDGQHFGYPHVHAGDILDPEFGEGHDPRNYVAPAARLGAHVAPLGLEFYTGTQFPSQYKNQIFIAEHGSWNRTEKSGYRISLVRLDENGDVSDYETFASGWLQGEENWGRPVDLELMPDGSMLVSDDQGGKILRISYEGMD